MGLNCLNVLIPWEWIMTEQQERALFWWCMIAVLLGFWVVIGILVT